MQPEIYSVLIVVDNEHRIARAKIVSDQHAGTQSYETAWHENETVTITSPEDGHEIMTYDEKEEALGELLTSVRDHFDDATRYR